MSSVKEIARGVAVRVQEHVNSVLESKYNDLCGIELSDGLSISGFRIRRSSKVVVLKTFPKDDVNKRLVSVIREFIAVVKKIIKEDRLALLDTLLSVDFVSGNYRRFNFAAAGLPEDVDSVERVMILAEKTQQASAIADALGLVKVRVRTPVGRMLDVYEGMCRYGMLNGCYCLIVPASGHLLELRGTSSEIVFFDFKWSEPTLKRNEDAYGRLHVIKSKCVPFVGEGSNFNRVVIATDNDDEGELIGYNIVHLLEAEGISERMVFQSLTESAIRRSVDNIVSLRMPVVFSAMFRSWCDKSFGYVFSKFLTTAYRNVTGSTYIQLGVGRVQTPPLAEIVKNTREIEAFERNKFSFVPEVKWRFNLRGLAPFFDRYSGIKIPEENFDISEDDALSLAEKYRNTKLTLKEIKSVDKIDETPRSGLKIDEVRSEMYDKGLDYSRVDQILESLYLLKLITYPRSESTVLPDEPSYHIPIRDAISAYLNLSVGFERDVPVMGTESDGAHDAIHPTGVIPGTLPPDYRMVFDFICRNYVCGFCEDRIYEEFRVYYNVVYDEALKTDEFAEQRGSTIFVVAGSRTKNHGYVIVNEPYLVNVEEPTPVIGVEEGDEFPVWPNITTFVTEPDEPEKLDKKALFEFMVRHRLGTDATRTGILDKMWDSNYLRGEKAFPTMLGIKVNDAIIKINPKLTEIELTRDFERIRERIMEGTTTLDGAMAVYREEIRGLVEERMSIMEELGNEIAYFGECDRCHSRMQIVSWKRGGQTFFFLACSSDGCDFKASV